MATKSRISDDQLSLFSEVTEAELGNNLDEDAIDDRRDYRAPGGHLSQSELDWAYAERALARGESPEAVTASIADYRRREKADPEYYARLTVRKAAQDLSDERVSAESTGPDR